MRAKIRTVTIHDARYRRLLGPPPIEETAGEIAQGIVRQETDRLKARAAQPNKNKENA